MNVVNLGARGEAWAKRCLDAAQDWEKAANLRDLEDKLKKQRAKFIRRWPKNS